MPTGRRARRRPGRRSQNASNAATTALLKSIDERLLSTQVSMVPDVKDPMPLRVRRDKVYTIEQSVESAIAGQSTMEVDGTLFYTLNLFANLTALTTLFDTYRLVSITVSWVPLNTVPSSSAPVYTATDFDDAISTPITTLLNYDTLKIAPSGIYFERTFTPAMALAAYGGAFTSYAQRKMQWCDCASPGVQWFGLKYGIPPSGSASPPNWQVTSKVVLQFKNPR